MSRDRKKEDPLAEVRVGEQRSGEMPEHVRPRCPGKGHWLSFCARRQAHVGPHTLESIRPLWVAKFRFSSQTSISHEGIYWLVKIVMLRDGACIR